MKRLAQLLLFLLSLCCAFQVAAAENEFRTWESTAGTSIEARLVGSASDYSITLEKKDGTTFVLRPNQLSSDDQRYLEQLAAMANAPQRILFIGNSYTRGIQGMVTKMVAASPYSKCQLSFVSPGGKTLEFHLENAGTMQKIRDGNWDIVVLQDQSQTPAIFPDQFQDAAKGIDKIIDDSGAKTVFYETWGRRDGDKQNAHLFPTYEDMQEALSKSYARAARSCKAELAPVGQAWAELRKAEPELGRQLYTGDGSHPAGPGAYLAACVFYATLFDADPTTVNFNGDLPEETVRAIHDAVSKTIR
jgi:hypothetical protein